MNKKTKSISRRFFFLSLFSFTSFLTLIGGCKFKLRKNQNSQTDELNKDFSVSGETTLGERAAAKGLIYGAFVQGDYHTFFKDQKFKSNFIKECELVVAGFYWNWGGIRPTASTFNFTDTDKFAKFAKENKMLLRGHPLIWYRTTPDWLIDKFSNPSTTSQEIKNILVDHITTVAGRYSGRIHSWDVVNEAIYIKDGRDDGFRDTNISGINGEKCPSWFDFLGKDYIDLAFNTAAKADPQAILVYNDNNLNYDTPNDEAKRNAVLNLLRYLKKKGTPVHAFGIQAHLDATKNNRFNPKKFRQFLKDIASLDLKIIISELDVRDGFLQGDIVTRDQVVAQGYHDFLSVVLDEPAVIAIATWGLSDRYSWVHGTLHQNGTRQRPLPLDSNLNRKPAWHAIAKAFDNAPRR